MSSHAYREVIAMVAYLHAGTQRWNMADDDSRYLMGEGYAHLKSAAIALLSDAFNESTAHAIWNVMISDDVDVTSAILGVCEDICGDAMSMQEAIDYDTAYRAGHNFTQTDTGEHVAYAMTYRGRPGMLVESYKAAEAAMVTIGREMRLQVESDIAAMANRDAVQRARAYYTVIGH